MTKEQFKELPIRKQANIVADMLNDGVIDCDDSCIRDGYGYQFDSDVCSIHYHTPSELVEAFELYLQETDTDIGELIADC